MFYSLGIIRKIYPPKSPRPLITATWYANPLRWNNYDLEQTELMMIYFAFNEALVHLCVFAHGSILSQVSLFSDGHLHWELPQPLTKITTLHFFLDFSCSTAKLDCCDHFQISLYSFFFPLRTFGDILVTSAARGWLISTSYFAALLLLFKSPEIRPDQSRFHPVVSGVYGPEWREALCLDSEDEEFSLHKNGILLLET